jgi:hypothetical protein
MVLKSSQYIVIPVGPYYNTVIVKSEKSKRQSYMEALICIKY